MVKFHSPDDPANKFVRVYRLEDISEEDQNLIQEAQKSHRQYVFAQRATRKAIARLAMNSCSAN